MTYIYQVSRVLLQEQVKKFGYYMNGRMLDAGSGSYARYRHLLSCKSVVRMDIKAGPNVDVIGSADTMPFKDNEFDAVLSTQVFEHLEYPEKATTEIFRVLKLGGHVLITVPQWNELHEEPHDYWRYTCFGLKALFERNGFSVVAYEQCGGFFSTRTQMGIRYLIDRFQLYRRWWSRPISTLFHIWGSVAICLDRLDTSVANRKHTIGWTFVFKKNKKQVSLRS
jgi:SAM-dependent methyltransferase